MLLPLERHIANKSLAIINNQLVLLRCAVVIVNCRRRNRQGCLITCNVCHLCKITIYIYYVNNFHNITPFSTLVLPHFCTHLKYLRIEIH